ncbi:TetR/AcrR family transcriptional regulator [Paenibacillus phytohabitans]|nr:TetR/AcrR family transcriptional regulator [Paenibacillus phytohabitans]
MIVYYSLMRHKDENKSEAIFQATLELLNEIGFSDTSMSKIAKRAQVSPSTIYVYFANKEDMLGKLYTRVKEKMSLNMVHGLEADQPVQQGMAVMMRNLRDFLLENRDYFLFLEQFSNSPLLAKLCLDESMALMFKPLHDYIGRGKQQGVLKQLDASLLLTYCYFPVTALAKEHFKGNGEFNEDRLSEIIKLSWDAIKA